MQGSWVPVTRCLQTNAGVANANTSRLSIPQMSIALAIINAQELMVVICIQWPSQSVASDKLLAHSDIDE
jgi:hypothetical protein